MKANNGVLVVDDFGRQLMFAAASCSPLDRAAGRRIDYLSLPLRGEKFQIPFETMSSFRPNLDPRELADEAFSAPLAEQGVRGGRRAAVVRPTFSSGWRAPGTCLRAGYRGVPCASSATAR